MNMCCCPLVLSVAICCTMATCCGPHACPLSSTLCPPSASCHWPCVVVWGVTFFLSQMSGVFLCPLVLSVAICCILAICHVPNACPLPSALHSLPSVWSCGVLPLLFPCTCVLSHVCLLCSALCSPLLLLLTTVALCCHLTTCFVPSFLCPLHSTLCPPISALCLLPFPNLLIGLLSGVSVLASSGAF